MGVIKKIVKQTINSIGYDLVKKSPGEAQVIFPDLDGDIVDTFRVVQPYTMTSLERVNALCLAAKYIVKANIQGDVVECGVWKGGSMMAAARTLAQAGDQSRNLYLFDTYEGMTEAADRDVSYNGVPAAHIAKQIGGKWCYGPLDEVREVLHSTGYDHAKIHFIKGPVEDTIPAQAPVSIALLRLDTDWYQSTKHELEHLFPRLTDGAVLIIDDYGHWKGCREAVDEYLSERNIPLLLNRIDNTGRVAIVRKR